ncbi:hypothetical protein RCF98_13625 [Thiothrix lacustris]|uniref:Uncharacterized protein n=1 Tax=Thiothrix lacustris TaxID=525917 RepID=A0ABY9MN95_9GAMM|nr:hypothetical protein [Thiothrix lacustris]WML90003.1 hypothetical protein RCF98_13625 [Thiothrix lacustris]
MNKKPSSGSFDIILDMEHVGHRDNVCMSFGAGLFRKLGWVSGSWLAFDTSETGKIAFHQVEEPSETTFNVRKLKLQGGFYKVCFYSPLYRFPKGVALSKEKALFNANSWTLTLAIPEEYWVLPEEDVPPAQARAQVSRELSVDDIAAAFSKM